VTKDLPRSPDGLPMDWIKVPFGPFFPGLPSGLLLTLTLDGDTVAATESGSLVGRNAALPVAGMDASGFVDYLGGIDPLAPMAFRLLACRALQVAAGLPADQHQQGHIAAVERERIASHLGWLAHFGEQAGFGWLARRAASLQRQCLSADSAGLAALRPALSALSRRLVRTPLLKSRLSGIGELAADPKLRGPVARAAGLHNDARGADPGYAEWSFIRGPHPDHPSGQPPHQTADAFARLQIRLTEIEQSLTIIQTAGDPQTPEPQDLAQASGEGSASVETPRGEARLQLSLAHGRLIHAQLDTASSQHLQLLPALLTQQELGDALTVVASLDLSPWEILT